MPNPGARPCTPRRAGARLAVVAKCEHLEPLPAWPVDASNPQARAFVGRNVPQRPTGAQDTCQHQAQP
jgi:hypothetical protein